MNLVKWINRIAIFILMWTLAEGINAGIPIVIVGEFLYLFFIENYLLRISAQKETSIWWVTAHNVYMENNYNISYIKWMWVSFILMLQEDYDE